MRLYLLPVMGMCFAVDGLLLGAAGSLGGIKLQWSRVGLSAALGALYAGACFLPQMQPFSGFPWRLAMLLAMGAIAYGAKGWGSIALFVLLNLACGALTLAVDGPATPLVCGLVIAALTFVGIRGKRDLVAVELCWSGKRERVVALRDTGNGLRDPITGEQVLIVGPEVAGRLVGLSKKELRFPVETLASGRVPGLRLIPCTTVSGKGMLLALRLPQVRFGHVCRSALVAFAADGLDEKGGFEALTGGVV